MVRRRVCGQLGALIATATGGVCAAIATSRRHIVCAPVVTESPSTSAAATASIDEPWREKLFAGVLLVGVSGVALVGGFSYALGAVRKQHMDEIVVDREAVRLAYRALGLGTLYAVVGVGMFTFLIAQLVGVKSIRDFRDSTRERLRPHMPKVSPGDPNARTEFSSFRELLTYIESGEGKSKQPVSTDEMAHE